MHGNIHGLRSGRSQWMLKCTTNIVCSTLLELTIGSHREEIFASMMGAVPRALPGFRKNRKHCLSTRGRTMS